MLFYLYQKCYFYNKIFEVSKNETDYSTCYSRRTNIDINLKVQISCKGKIKIYWLPNEKCDVIFNLEHAS